MALQEDIFFFMFFFFFGVICPVYVHSEKPAMSNHFLLERDRDREREAGRERGESRAKKLKPVWSPPNY